MLRRQFHAIHTKFSTEIWTRGAATIIISPSLIKACFMVTWSVIKLSLIYQALSHNFNYCFRKSSDACRVPAFESSLNKQRHGAFRTRARTNMRMCLFVGVCLSACGGSTNIRKFDFINSWSRYVNTQTTKVRLELGIITECKICCTEYFANYLLHPSTYRSKKYIHFCRQTKREILCEMWKTSLTAWALTRIYNQCRFVQLKECADVEWTVRSTEVAEATTNCAQIQTHSVFWS